MKLLMIYAGYFGYETSVKALDSEAERSEKRSLENVLVGFIHAEPHDEEQANSVETHLVKNLKWAARKNDTNRILLHSFAHLAEEKASPEFTKQLLQNTEERLAAAGYEATQTPFGFFLNLHLEAPGRPLARLFKSL